MSNTTAIKRRITSVKSTKQITKAMELVAASKMRRAQEHALRSRDFSQLAGEILARLRVLTDVKNHPLFKTRTVRTRLHLLVTSDRGLAGAYNSNLLRQFTNELKTDRDNNIASQVLVIGKQGSKLATRLKDVTIVAAYHDFPEQPTANDLRPILNTVVELYTNKTVDAIDLVYTDYRSSISQVVVSQRLLPAAFEAVAMPKNLDQAVFEPSPEKVLESVTERLIEAQLNQAFSESQASEHSMRMMAMKNATDNATDLIDDLTLAFNTARQAAITQELAEITGGAEAMK